MSEPSPFRHFHGMCWPETGDRLDALEHRLRYAPLQTALTWKIGYLLLL